MPLAAAGGFVLLWLTGQSINAVSMIGIVVMIGMADNEAVVKLDAIRRYREDGHPLRDAIAHLCFESSGRKCRDRNIHDVPLTYALADCDTSVQFPEDSS